MERLQWGSWGGGCERHYLLCHQVVLVERWGHLRWDKARERLSWEESIDGGLRLVRAGSYSSIDGKFPLSEVVLQVAENTKAKRVLGIHSLHADHVARHLCHCLPEAHETVVKECPGVAIGCVGISCTAQEEKVERGTQFDRDGDGRKETGGGRHAVVHSVRSLSNIITQCGMHSHHTA